MLKLLLGNPWVFGGIAAVIIALAVGGFVEDRLRVAAEKGEKAARLESDLHAADAERYRAAVADRDTRITGLAAQLNTQSDLVEQGRAKESELRKSLDSARLENERMQRDADQLSKELQDEASKSPGDVRPVGPIVARRAPGLFN